MEKGKILLPTGPVTLTKVYTLGVLDALLAPLPSCKPLSGTPGLLELRATFNSSNCRMCSIGMV